MEKIPTIFKRDWEGNRGVINEYVIDPKNIQHAVATEKLDGMNVRITVRNHIAVRLEKRRNPSKLQKAQGIKDPWYVDAIEGPEDKWLFSALKFTDLSDIPDGEWSGEALGEHIQGNPLGLTNEIIMFFSLGKVPVFENVPTTFDELKVWLPLQESKFGKGKIEGIVWHSSSGLMAKIKTKDFKSPSSPEDK